MYKRQLIFTAQYGINNLIEIASFCPVVLTQHAIPMHAQALVKADTDQIIRIDIQPDVYKRQPLRRSFRS